MGLKIRAYTLMEVTVAMLLSAICISICYTAYGIIGDYYHLFHQKNESADQVLSLKHALEKDFLKSNYILKQEDGFELLIDTTKIHYSFEEQAVLRKFGAIHTDTFKLQTKALKATFEGKELLEIDTIDQVSFTILLDKNTFTTIEVNKWYSAQNLFH